MEELMELLSALKPEIDFETEIEDQFGIEIPAEEIVPENFNSAEGIWNLMERIKGEE